MILEEGSRRAVNPVYPKIYVPIRGSVEHFWTSVKKRKKSYKTVFGKKKKITVDIYTCILSPV